MYHRYGNRASNKSKNLHERKMQAIILEKQDRAKDGSAELFSFCLNSPMWKYEHIERSQN